MKSETINTFVDRALSEINKLASHPDLSWPCWNDNHAQVNQCLLSLSVFASRVKPSLYFMRIVLTHKISRSISFLHTGASRNHTPNTWKRNLDPKEAWQWRMQPHLPFYSACVSIYPPWQRLWYRNSEYWGGNFFFWHTPIHLTPEGWWICYPTSGYCSGPSLLVILKINSYTKPFK